MQKAVCEMTRYVFECDIDPSWGDKARDLNDISEIKLQNTPRNLRNGLSENLLYLQAERPGKEHR
jgi:hypothetical protein